MEEEKDVKINFDELAKKLKELAPLLLPMIDTDKEINKSWVELKASKEDAEAVEKTWQTIKDEFGPLPETYVEFSGCLKENRKDNLLSFLKGRELFARKLIEQIPSLEKASTFLVQEPKSITIIAKARQGIYKYIVSRKNETSKTGVPRAECCLALLKEQSLSITSKLAVVYAVLTNSGSKELKEKVVNALGADEQSAIENTLSELESELPLNTEETKIKPSFFEKEKVATPTELVVQQTIEPLIKIMNNKNLHAESKLGRAKALLTINIDNKQLQEEAEKLEGDNDANIKLIGKEGKR